jgi:hypothetical protein
VLDRQLTCDGFGRREVPSTSKRGPARVLSAYVTPETEATAEDNAAYDAAAHVNVADASVRARDSAEAPSLNWRWSLPILRGGCDHPRLTFGTGP